MTCETVKLPGGGSAIVCGRGKPRAGRCTFCHLAGSFLCDWKMPNGGLCNRAVCVEHRTNVAPGKDLCPEHAEAYVEWKKKREKEKTA